VAVTTHDVEEVLWMKHDLAVPRGSSGVQSPPVVVAAVRTEKHV